MAHMSSKERATRVNSNEAAAARPDLRDIDCGNAHVIATTFQKPRPEVDARPDVELSDPVVEAAFDHRRLGRCSAHVEGEDVLVAELPGDLRRADDAGGRPGFDDVHGACGGGIDPHGPAVRLHDPERTGDLEAAQDPLEGSKIGAHNGQDVGVHHRRAGAFVFPDLGVHLARQAHRQIEASLPDDLRDATLVLVVGIAVDERDRDRLDTVPEEPVERVANARFVERLKDAAGVLDPFGNLDAVDPGGKRLWLLPLEVIEAGHAKTPDLEDVAEPGGGDEARPDAPLLQDRIRGDGSAVDDLFDLSSGDPDARQGDFEALRNTAAVVVRGRRNLDGKSMPRVSEEDEIGERPADIDTYTKAQPWPPGSFPQRRSGRSSPGWSTIIPNPAAPRARARSRSTSRARIPDLGTKGEKRRWPEGLPARSRW